VCFSRSDGRFGRGGYLKTKNFPSQGLPQLSGMQLPSIGLHFLNNALLAVTLAPRPGYSGRFAVAGCIVSALLC
jgi:hypothetical protein